MTRAAHPDPIAEVMGILTETPRRITELTTGVAPDRLRAMPPFGGWSAVEVLAHLRSCADMWGGSVITILEEDTPTLEAMNPNRWIRSTNYRELQFPPSLRAFVKQRTELLAVLDPLPPDAWERFANVKVWGAVYERSVLFYARWLAKHERSHYRQIQRIAEAMRG